MQPQLARRAMSSGVLLHFTHHGAGVYNTKSLVELGGYHAGVRVGFDTAVLRVLTDLGRVVYLDEPMYDRHQTQGGLTTDPKTGYHSAYRKAVCERLTGMVERTMGKASPLPTIPSDLRAARSRWKSEVSRAWSPTEEHRSLVSRVRERINGVLRNHE